MKKKILMTGGGTAGHVIPNIALIPELVGEGYEIAYMGSYKGMERKMIEEMGIPYYPIHSGKLRRYLSFQNVTDLFKVASGTGEAAMKIRRIKPDLIFSKGGFVCVPVILGGRVNRVPSIIHESDFTPGLANKIAMSSAKKICVTFPETLSHVPKNKGVLTGAPIRKEILNGDKETGYAFCGFTRGKPVLLVMGGSLGSVAVNTAVRGLLDQLLKKFQVVHICGKNHVDMQFKSMKGYKQFSYVGKELPDLYAAADLVVSRAGSGSIAELAALHKPHLLIPLSKAASRGDQIMNAKSFETQGFSLVIQEEELNGETLLEKINYLYENQSVFIDTMQKKKMVQGTANVLKVIKETLGKS